MTEISGKSLHEIYKEDARKYKESIEKERLYDKSLTVTMPTQEFDKIQKLALSAHTDKLSVEKLQEIRVEELKDFNSKILQAELKNQKLQKEIDAAKKYIEESYKADKEDNKLLDLIIEAVAKLKSDNETLKKALTEIAEIINDDIHECNYGCDNSCELNGSLDMYSVENVQSVIDSALAAIGGEND